MLIVTENYIGKKHMDQKIDGKWQTGKLYYVYTDDGIDSFWLPLSYRENPEALLESLVYFIEEGIWWTGSEEGEDAISQIESLSEFQKKPKTEDLINAAKDMQSMLPATKWGPQRQEFIRFCFRVL